MTKAARDAGHIKIAGVEFPQDRIQILAIEDLFNDKKPKLPFISDNTTFKKPNSETNKSTQSTINYE